MASTILTHARRIALGGTAGITGFAAYKSRTDPIHIFWDLDHTILCSITPIPTDIDDDQNSNDNGANGSSSKCPVSPSNLASTLLPSPPRLRRFDQIDDDFPYEGRTPNTRTYFRPGAEAAIRLCGLFGIVHVYTAAQASYTNNILNELDFDGDGERTEERGGLFDKVLHRDDHPRIVKEGKCLLRAAGTTEDLRRAVLFDDKVSNFKPQNYENGVAVVPFTEGCVRRCCSGSWSAYLGEVGEMSRLVCIAFWSSVHYSGDARRVVGWVRDRKDARRQ